MVDWIEILAAPLSLALLVWAILSLRLKSYLLAVAFLVLAILPLLWAGYFRLPIPQTLVWMGMNICAIIFLWQGFLGLLTKSDSSDLMPIPYGVSTGIKNMVSLMTGLLFAVLIILTRI
jgi:hypothetical protein